VNRCSRFNDKIARGEPGADEGGRWSPRAWLPIECPTAGDKENLMKSWKNWRGFLALWGFLFLAYTSTRVAFNLIVHGWIDLRRAAFLDIAVVPLVLSLLLWLGFRLYRRVA
jgi:hypothetical protein